MTLNPGHLPNDTPNEKSYNWLPLLEGLSERADWDRDLIEHSHDLLCIHNLEGKLLSVNPRPAQLLGYTVEELLRIPMRNLIAPRSRQGFDEYLRAIVRDGKASGLITVLTRGGEERIWEFHNSLRTEGVTTPVVRCVAHDVTERIRIEKKLREAVRRLSKLAVEQGLMVSGLKLFRTLLDNSNDAIEVVDPQTMRFIDVNETACSELGYTRDELLSMSVFDIDPRVTRESIAQAWEHLRKVGFLMIETEHRRKDGTTFPVEINIKRLELDRPYVIAICRDISERKARDVRLQEFERVVESLEEAIVVVDRDYRYVLANRAFLRRHGITQEEVIGHSAIEILRAEAFDSIIKARLDEAFAGKLVSYEMNYGYPEVGVRRLEITYLPIEGPNGIDRVAAILRDVTERQRAATALEESERRFRALYERAPVGIALVESHTGKFLQVNPKYCEIIGRSEQEMLGMTFLDITHPEDLKHSDHRLTQMIEEKLSGYDLEKRYLRADGRAVWVNLSVVPMWERDEQIRWHMAIAQDITERRMAEEALRESEERMRLAQEVARIGTFDRDFATGEPQWSPQMEEMYGLPPGGAPRSIGQFLELVHPNDRERVSELIDRSIQAGDGHGEWRVVWPNGSVRWISGRWRVLKDAAGQPLRFVGADYDITHRKHIEHELRLAKERLTEEKLYLEHEIDTEFGFEEIIGKSRALKAVMESAGRVASSDATVLLLGETGTGKELIARAVHRLSQRAGNAFIKMNCAAIPSGLLESELFGAEKGAYTGATSRKIGRLELADKGTMFLDEIGEIALSLQPKLLRVLQDQEFERLGGTHTIKVNFRLIAATNRDLAEQVRDNQFRRDLYYRLNVFPIDLPPLRERQEDIPMLVEHFVQKCAKRMGRSITSIPRKTMDTLIAWHWPGNVRELENFIERSVILTNGSVLTAPLSELEASLAASIRKNETLEAAERRHILEALRQSNGRISGQNGAAARLGLKRTTLQSKLKQMKINPRTPPEN